MLRTAPCEWALKEVSLFSSVIDFSPEKYIVFTGQQVLLVPTNEDNLRSRGTQSFDTQGIHSRLQILPQMYLSSLCQKRKKYEKGLQIPYDTCRYHILQIYVFTNHIFKLFYVYTKVPNLAKKFDHKILD